MATGRYAAEYAFFSSSVAEGPGIGVAARVARWAASGFQVGSPVVAVKAVRCAALRALAYACGLRILPSLPSADWRVWHACTASARAVAEFWPGVGAGVTVGFAESCGAGVAELVTADAGANRDFAFKARVVSPAASPHAARISATTAKIFRARCGVASVCEVAAVSNSICRIARLRKLSSTEGDHILIVLG